METKKEDANKGKDEKKGLRRLLDAMDEDDRLIVLIAGGDYLIVFSCYAAYCIEREVREIEISKVFYRIDIHIDQRHHYLDMSLGGMDTEE